MAGPGETLGSPWIPLAIRACLDVLASCGVRRSRGLWWSGVFGGQPLLRFFVKDFEAAPLQDQFKTRLEESTGVWQGVAMDSLKYH
jgi:hypothetical protein